MKDFEKKIIKVNLNSDSGWVCITGKFIKMEENFLVIINNLNKKIEYISMFYIKTIEILGDIPLEDEYDE